MYFRESESPYGNKRMLIQWVTVPNNNSPNQVRICRAKGAHPYPTVITSLVLPKKQLKNQLIGNISIGWSTL